MKILLASGFEILLDDEDFDHFKKWEWYCSEGHYARRKESGINFYLHIEVMKRTGLFEEDKQVDHKNRIRTDCQRSNLRMATLSQQRVNREQENNHSKFRGVRKIGLLWYAYTCHKRKQKSLGGYKTEIEAALAYNRLATLYHGEFAIMNNIPEEG